MSLEFVKFTLGLMLMLGIYSFVLAVPVEKDQVVKEETIKFTIKDYHRRVRRAFPCYKGNCKRDPFYKNNVFPFNPTSAEITHNELKALSSTDNQEHQDLSDKSESKEPLESPECDHDEHKMKGNSKKPGTRKITKKEKAKNKNLEISKVKNEEAITDLHDEDSQSQDSQTQDSQSQDSQSQDNQSQDSQTQDSQSQDSQSQDK